MQQLSGQDASFLYLETPNAPMHIGSVAIYDQSSLPGGVQSFKAILNRIGERLHLARPFREKIVKVPFNMDHPYWINDANFDLEYHVRHIRLPAPGDWRQLCIQVARLHARALDLSKPLWEFTVIEGLDAIAGLPHGCYAIISKVHHAAVDGASGVDMTTAIHDLTQTPSAVPPGPPFQPEAAPNPFELVMRAQMNNFMQPFHFAEVLARSIPALTRLSQGFLNSEFRAPGPVPSTRFSKPVSPHRVFEGRRFDLAEMRAMRRALQGATINDLVLAICGGALRRYLLAKNELPDQTMVAMAPISVRSTDQQGSMGNQVAAMNVELATHIEDPRKRLAAVHSSAQSSKAMTNAIGAKLMTDYSRFVPSTMAGLAARRYSELGLANSTAVPFNCVVTNVPGPQVPLYCAGAPLVTQFGMGPIFDGMGLMMPVYSYAGELTIAATSCRDMMPDPEFFSSCIQDAYDEMKHATIS